MSRGLDDDLMLGNHFQEMLDQSWLDWMVLTECPLTWKVAYLCVLQLNV